MPLFIDYKESVFREYREKKIAGLLTWRLAAPTLAGLKEECLVVCSDSNRYKRRDEKTLMEFFGKHDNQAAYIQAIRNFDREKFKAFNNYLKNPSIDTKEKNVELLAWLIDFEYRPYDVWASNKDKGAEISYGNEEEPESEQQNDYREKDLELSKAPIKPENGANLPSPSSPLSSQYNRSKVRITIVAMLVLILLGALGYWFRNSNNGGCMYWAGDHYQQIPCDQKVANTLVIALDDHKLNNFKKITDISTINKRSKREVWYVKVNGEIEFYTAEGFHPTELQLRLKPVTDYIIDKYVLKTP